MEDKFLDQVTNYIHSSLCEIQSKNDCIKKYASDLGRANLQIKDLDNQKNELEDNLKIAKSGVSALSNWIIKFASSLEKGNGMMKKSKVNDLESAMSFLKEYSDNNSISRGTPLKGERLEGSSESLQKLANILNVGSNSQSKEFNFGI